MTFGSLFSGIGGMDLGLERAGWTCKWQCEIDPFARKVLKKHWPEVPHYEDIRTLQGDELPPVDLLAGGFPCQDLSQAGKRAGIEGTRSGLWFEFARLIGELRPRFVVIENVPGLLIHNAMPRVVGELARLGYVGVWRCLRASDFGASHLRKRVFLIAQLADSAHDGRLGWPQAIDDIGDGTPGEAGQNGYIQAEPLGCGEELADGEHAGRLERGTPYNGNGHHAPRHDADGCYTHVEHGAGRGWRELRQSSTSHGLAHGSHPQLADAIGARSRDAEPERCGRPAAKPSGYGTDVEHAFGTRRTAAGIGCDLDAGHEPETGCGTVADSQCAERRENHQHDESCAGWQQAPDRSGSRSESLADSSDGFVPQGRNGIGSAGAQLDHAERPRLEIGNGQRTQYLEQNTESVAPGLPCFAPGPSDPRWPDLLRDRPDLAPALVHTKKQSIQHVCRSPGNVKQSGAKTQQTVSDLQFGASSCEFDSERRVEEAQSEICGVAVGTAHRLDGTVEAEIAKALENRTKRLSRLGNAVVPQCAQWIGRRLLEIAS